jgi:hypothetical protein
MIESIIRPFTWPPVQYDGWDVLLPMITPHPHMDHLTYLNMVNPPPNFPVPLRQAVIKAKVYKAGGQDG